jgi:hypothetical protein
VISQHGDTLVSNSITGNQWYLDGLAIPNATGQIHVAVYIGTYSVVVTQNGCSSAPSNSILVLPVSINEVEEAKTFNIYPNPTTGELNLDVVTTKKEVYNLEVFNNLGKLVWNQVNVDVDGIYNTKIDLNGLPAGVYFVTLRNKTNCITKKVILMR